MTRLKQRHWLYFGAPAESRGDCARRAPGVGWRIALGVALCLVALSACEERTPRARQQSAVALQTATPRLHRPAPAGVLRCEDLLPQPDGSSPTSPERIELRPPVGGPQVFISKVGVIVSFGRDEFLTTARCLKFDKAVAYVERETGFAERSPIMDAFQTSYVAAALLDAGRADVRRREEPASRPFILRDPWSEEGCRGRCRSSGRLYRLAEDEPLFFLRITDRTRSD